MAEAKETGRLFRPEMVRAILRQPPEQPKTMTRRIMSDDIQEWAKWMGCDDEPDLEESFARFARCKPIDDDGNEQPEQWVVYCSEYPEEGCIPIGECPWGKPGDRITVRESGRAIELNSGLDCVEYLADGAIIPIENTPEASDAWLKMRHYRGKVGAKVPSIHMPRWASRITLEIVDVRVERLQDISEGDAKAEGVEPNCSMIDHTNCEHDGTYLRYPFDPDGEPAYSAIESFQTLWQSINGPGSWDANPWVWVIEFQRVEGGRAQ